MAGEAKKWNNTAKFMNVSVIDVTKENVVALGQGIAFSHKKRENGKFVDEKFLTGKSDEKNGKLSSLK